MLYREISKIFREISKIFREMSIELASRRPGGRFFSSAEIKTSLLKTIFYTRLCVCVFSFFYCNYCTTKSYNRQTPSRHSVQLSGAMCFQQGLVMRSLAAVLVTERTDLEFRDVRDAVGNKRCSRILTYTHISLKC